MMLRIHCLQQWFGQSDLGAEEALIETTIYRDFVGLAGTVVNHVTQGQCSPPARDHNVS